MPYNVPEEEKPKFNKNVQSGLNLFAKDVQRTLGQLEVLQPETVVEAYNKPVQAPVTRDLTPLEQYVYEPQPVQEVDDLAAPPTRESMVAPQEQPQVLSSFRNQAEAQFGGDMVSITPEQQASTDLVAAEIDSIRNEAGEIPKSALELFSKPLNANSVRVLGLVDQEGNPTERGQLFYNLQQSGVFNEDGTINEKGQAYLTPIEDMINPEWFNQPGSKEKFDILWEDGVIRSSSTPGEILSGVTKFVGDAAYGAAELTQQQAMGLAYNSRTWGGLLGMEDSRPDYLKARGDVTELSVAENMYKNVIQTSNLIDVGLAGDKQFIDESIMSPLYGALEKITGIQRPQPEEIDQANANIKNSKDALVAARYNQWATDQRLADMEAGQIAETIFGIDNATQTAEAAKQKLGADEFNKVYGRVGAFTNIAGDPTNAVPAAFAVKASRAVPLASRAMLGAQKTMGQIAAMDLAIAQGNTAVQASRAALAKAEPTVNLAQRMSVNFAEGAKTQPALLERSAKASQIAQRVTAEANQIKSTLPTITAELDNLVAKRNSLATRIPEEYSKKVLQTMELGRQVRAMPAKAIGATLERVGDTISKTDTAVTNFLQERGLDQMYTAAVGAAGVVGLTGSPIIGAIGAGAAALKTGKVLSNYGKLFRYVGKEMENVRGQIPFWKRVAAHTAPGSLGRGIAHAFNMLDLGGVTSDTLRRTGRGIVAAAPTDLMFEYLSDGADMRPDTLYQAAAESLVIGGSFAAAGGAFMGTKKRMRELSIGDELNFRRGLTDTRQKALFEAVPAGTRRAISTYAIANPTLNYIFKDSGASRYDPNTNTAVINVKSTNPIKALVAHETLHHSVIKNNMEPGISALFLGDTKNNTVGGLFRSRDGKLDPNFEAFRDGYYKRLGVEGMSNAERDAIYPLDKIAVEYFIEKHADQYAAMAESGELGAVAASGAARRKLGSILETVLPRIPVLKDLHFKSGGMIDKNGAWVTGNGILDAEGVKRDPITSKMFRDMNRRSAGLVPGQFDPLMSDKPDSGAPILLNPADGIDAELLHPLVQVDDTNKPIMKDGKPVALDRATELSRALAGLTAKEVLQRKRSENYAPEKGEAYVDDEGQFQPGWLSNDVLTEMFAKNKYNPEQKRIIREMNKLIRKGAGDRVVMINFPATARNKAGKVVYKPQQATLRDTVPVAVTISKDGNLLFGLMSVTKLHENIQKRSQDRRGKKLYGGNVDLILRDTQAMMDYHKQGVDSIEFFKQKYGAVEADERKKFINTMFGLLNQKEQAVLNPILLEDGVKSRDNVYRTYRADRVSKAVPMSPEEYPAMPFSYEAVSAVRMPEQRQMPEAEAPSPEDSKNWFKKNRSNFIHVNIRGNEIDPSRDFTGWVLPVGRDPIPDANVMNTRYGNVGKQVVLVPKEFVTNSKYNPDKIKPGFRPSPEQIGTITEESINPNGTINWSKVFAKPTAPAPSPTRFMPEGEPKIISEGTKDALPVVQAVDKDGNPKFKDGQEVPQIIPYDFLASARLNEYDKNDPIDKTKPNYQGLAYDIPKPAQNKINQAIDSGAVDDVVKDVVKRTRAYLKNPEIAAGMGWYSRMRVKLLNALGESGRETLSQLLGATSARTPVRENFLQAMDAYEGIQAGRYEQNRKAYIDMLQLQESGTFKDAIISRDYLGKVQSKINEIEAKANSLKGSDKKSFLDEAKKLQSLINKNPNNWNPSDMAKIAIIATDMLPRRSNGKKFNANSLAVLKVIHGSWLDNRNAPKTPNFAGNLSGRTLQATIDVWAARFLRAVLYEGKNNQWRIQPKAESAVSNEDFALGQIVFERAAKKLKMNPDDLQAVLWFAEKDRWDKMGWTKKVGAEKSSFDDIFSIFFPEKQKPLNFEQASAKLALENE